MMDTNKKAKQLKEWRKGIVAECYRKGYSIRKTCKEIERLEGRTKPISTKVVFDYRNEVLAEWKAVRIEHIEEAIQEQIMKNEARIDMLYDEWERSKEKKLIKTKKSKGAMVKVADNEKVKPLSVESYSKEEESLGDIRYLQEIRLLEEKNLEYQGYAKIEKREITGKDGAALGPLVTFLSAENMTQEQIEQYLNASNNN